MADLDHGGVRVGLPRLGGRDPRAPPDPARAQTPDGSLSVAAAAPPLVTLHAANFALPPVRGDYGSGAVEVMPTNGVFVALLEFSPDSVGSALFAQEGLPLPLEPAAFSPRSSSDPGRGSRPADVLHVGGRPFCVYVVIGNYL